MKSILQKLVILFLIVTHANGSASTESRILKARVTEFKPQYYKDKNQKWTGIDVELTRALVKEAGFEVEFVDLPWQRGVKSLQDGTIDLIPGFGVSEERKDYTIWIGPMRDVKVVLIVKKSNVSLSVRSLDDMQNLCKKTGKKFGYQRGAFWSKEFNDRLAGDKVFASCFETVTEAEQIMKMTLAERLLGFFEIKLSLDYLIKRDPDYQGLAIHPFVLEFRPTFWGLSKKAVSSEHIVRLFKAHETLTKNGTLDRLRSQ